MCYSNESLTVIFDSSLTQQQQLHFFGGFLAVLAQIPVNHFGSLGRGFIFLAHGTAHGSECALQGYGFMSIDLWEKNKRYYPFKATMFFK